MGVNMDGEEMGTASTVTDGVTGDCIMGVNMDGEEISSGSTVPAEVKQTETACKYDQQHEHGQGLTQDADCDEGIQEQKSAKGSDLPLITSLQNMRSQHTSGALNTGHNEAQTEHTDGGDRVLSNTPSLLRPDADKEDQKKELSHGTLVNTNTDTSADDKCLKLEACSSSLQPEEIMDISETDTNDDSEAMYDTLLDEISPSDDKAKLELSFNHDLDQMDEKGYTPLYKAALEGHLEDVDALISQGANPNKPSKGGLRPLHAAAHEGQERIIDFLILQGADVSAECERGRTPLQTATAKHDKGMNTLHGATIPGDLKVMEYLIHIGSYLKKEDAKNSTPLNAAVQNGHIEALKYLTTEGAEKNRFFGMTPLYAAAELGNLDVVKYFISEGADVNEEDDKEKIPLHGAATRGHTDVIEYLIQQGSDVNKKNNLGWTPFNAAVQYGHLEAVKYLMTKGAKQNRYAGLTPIYAAAQFGHLHIVKFFISEGAHVNEEDEKGKIPLHGAAFHGHLNVMKYLIQEGSDVNKADVKGWTPINAAVQGGHLEAVKYLMTEEEKQKRYDGMTPLYAAARFGHLDVVEFFISNGADVNEENGTGQIPLHGAAIGGNTEIMEYLIQQGSDVNKADGEGWTPFNAAVQGGHLEAVKYLMTTGEKQNTYDGMLPLHAIFDHLTLNGADIKVKDIENLTRLRAAANATHQPTVDGILSCRSDSDEEETVYPRLAGGHRNLITRGYVTTTMNEADTNSRTSSHVHNAEDGNDCNQAADIAKRGADELSLKNLPTRTHGVEENEGLPNVNEYISPRKGDSDAEDAGDPQPGGLHYGAKRLATKSNVMKKKKNKKKEKVVQMKEAGTQPRTGQLAYHVANAEDGNDCLQADNAKRGADELSLKNLQEMAHDVENDIGRPNENEHLSPRKGYVNEENTGDSISGGHHYSVKRLATKSNVKKKKKNKKKEKVVQIKEVDTQSRTGQLASQVDNVQEGNDYTQADNGERAADELSLKNLPTRIHGDEKGANGEHNPFIHAKPKYPDKGVQDSMLDHMEAIKCSWTRKRDTIFTNGTDCSSLRVRYTWAQSVFDPPYLQTTETDHRPSEEMEFRCHSLIDENKQMREPFSPMNAGNHLQINETSMKFKSFPTHPPAVVRQTLSDGNPVPIQGTSSNSVWKIGTKRRTSVYRCFSILTLVQTLLQTIIALAIILAGSPVLVAGSDITERVTLQAGKPGVVPFLLPISPSNTSQIVLYYILRFESQPRPFCINGEADIEGFKSPSQLPRFTTSVIETVSSYCINLLIDIVDTLDEDRYVLTAVRRGYENVWHETIKKEIVVDFPPRPAICFITFSENDGYSYEVHCRATAGSVKATLSCYQNDQRIDIRGDIRDNGQVIRGIFWLSDNTYFSCCSHDINLNVSQTMCNDFESPLHKETTSLTVNTVSTVTTPTLQIESLTRSGACRQFMLPSLWHFTYLFVYFLTFATIY